jgi:hypothetical protein
MRPARAEGARPGSFGESRPRPSNAHRHPACLQLYAPETVSPHLPEARVAPQCPFDPWWSPGDRSPAPPTNMAGGQIRERFTDRHGLSGRPALVASRAQRRAGHPASTRGACCSPRAVSRQNRLTDATRKEGRRCESVESGDRWRLGPGWKAGGAPRTRRARPDLRGRRATDSTRALHSDGHVGPCWGPLCLVSLRVGPRSLQRFLAL